MKTTIPLVMIVVLLATWMPGFFQAPIDEPTAPWPPNLTDLLSRPFGGGGPPSISFEPAGQLGGATNAVVVRDNLAYIGSGPRLLLLDVTNPATPVLLGQTPALPDLVQGAAVAGNLVYVAAGEAGLYVFDAANPAMPAALSVYDTPGTAHMVAVSGDIAVVADSWSGVQVVDVGEPTRPRLLGSVDTPGAATGVVLVGALAYISDLDAGLRVIDVADPAHPVEIGSLDTPGHAWWLDVVEDTAYIADTERGLRIVDVANPTHPVEIGAYAALNNVVGVAVSGTTAFLADWWSGLHMVDVSNPAAPQELGAFDTPGYAVKVALRCRRCATTAFVADGDGGLRIVDVTDPVQPVELGFHSTLGSAVNMAVADSLVYVAGGYSGLHIVDAADPYHLREVGSYPVPGGCADVAVVGATAYVVTVYGGLFVLDVGDPTAPVLLSSHSLPVGSRSVAVRNNTAYVAAHSGALRMIDVTDPLRPQEVGSYGLTSAAMAVAVRGSIAYVAAGPAGLALIDVSDPQHPMLLSMLDTPGDARHVTLADQFAFVADWDGGVRMFDISDPRLPRELVPIQTPGPAAGVEVGRVAPEGWPRVVYVAQGQGGLAAADAINPDAPVASSDTPGSAEAVTVVGSTAFVADHAGGLSVLRVLRDRQEATIPTQGGSLAAADGSLIAIFPAGAFTETVTLTYERLANDENTGQRLGIGQTYRLSAVSATTGRPAALAPGANYALVARYTDYDLGPIVEESLRLRFQDNKQWMAESSSALHAQANAITALPQRLGWWAVLGETHRSYLPLIPGNAPLYDGDLICFGEGNVTFWAGEGGDAAVIDRVLANWIAACPSIEVEVRYLSFGRLREEFLAAAAAGDGPDFLVGAGDWIDELVAAGLLKPLDGFPLALVDVARFIPAAAEATRFRGQHYALPWYVQTIAMLYNKELIAAPPTTLEELLAAAASHGLAMNHDFYFAFWGIPAHGGAIFDESERCILDEAGFADWLDWLAAHQNDPGMTIDDDYMDLLDSFRQGHAALHPNGPWAIGSLGPDWVGKVGVAPLPAGPFGPAGPMLGVTGIMFSSVPDDAQTQLALQFARYLTGVEAQKILMDVAEQIPANVAVTSEDEVMAGFMVQARTAYPFPTTAKMAAVWQPGSDAYRAVLQGRMTGQEAASAVCAAVDGDAASRQQSGR